MNPALEAILQGSSLHELLILVSRVLSRSDFGDVQILDRRGPRQKSRYGGHEILCDLSLGLFPAKVAVKVLDQDVRLRNLDEMSGVVDRTGADLGVLFTPYGQSKRAIASRPKYRKSRIEVIDGPALTLLLMKHKIGVRDRSEVDYAFFGALEQQCRRLEKFIRENPS